MEHTTLAVVVVVLTMTGVLLGVQAAVDAAALATQVQQAEQIQAAAVVAEVPGAEPSIVPDTLAVVVL
jgi:hypothetical protein